MKAHKEEARKLQDEEFRRQMMEKFAEDDRIEQMNAQKRRMKQLGINYYSASYSWVADSIITTTTTTIPTPHTINTSPALLLKF